MKFLHETRILLHLRTTLAYFETYVVLSLVLTNIFKMSCQKVLIGVRDRKRLKKIKID